MTDDEKKIVEWLRRRADEWQTREGPHDEPVAECNCSFECGESISYRIVADSIEKGEHVGENRAIDFVERMSAAEKAVSYVLSHADVHGENETETTRAELIRESLSLARTLVTEAKMIYQKSTVNKAGLVQGKGSQIDTLAAELAVRLRMEGK